VLAVGSATSVTNNVSKTIIGVSLPAGDWDVAGTVYFVPAKTTTLTVVISSVSLTNNTPDLSTWYVDSFATYTGNGNTSRSTPGAPVRLSLSSTTSVYLVGQASFGTSTCTAYGKIRTGRIR
jgi:hypothetical protein